MTPSPLSIRPSASTGRRSSALVPERRAPSMHVAGRVLSGEPEQRGKLPSGLLAFPERSKSPHYRSLFPHAEQQLDQRNHYDQQKNYDQRGHRMHPEPPGHEVL